MQKIGNNQESLNTKESRMEVEKPCDSELLESEYFSSDDGEMAVNSTEESEYTDSDSSESCEIDTLKIDNKKEVIF